MIGIFELLGLSDLLEQLSAKAFDIINTKAPHLKFSAFKHLKALTLTLVDTSKLCIM